MKILIVEDEPEILELVVDIVDSSLGDGEVISAPDFQSAIKSLEAGDVDAVISDQNLPDGTGGKIYAHIMEKGFDIPFVLCSSEPPEAVPELKDVKIFFSVEKPNIVDPLMQAVEKLESNHTEKSGEEYTTPDYSRLRLQSLVKANSVPCDVFLKLSEKKYIKVLNDSDAFGQADFDHYQSKNVQYLYVKRDDAPSFLKNLTKTVTSIVEAAKASGDASQAIDVGSQAISTIQDSIRTLGITPEVQELTKESMDMAVQTIKKNPELKDLFKKFKSDPDSYISSHSNALSYISCHLLSMMPWRSDTGFYKLSLASMMHDISLENNELAAVDTLDELEEKKSQFTRKELEEYKKHTITAAELIRALDNMPPDVDAIVLQHHEKPDGSGFPHSIGAVRISPLSALFIVAHEIVRELNAKGDDFDLIKFMESAPKKYSRGQFRNIVKDARAHLGIPES